jgi:hypothetical protein
METNADEPEAFTCPECFMTSYHPEDKKFGYCGNCHRFTGVAEVEGADCD